MSKKNGKVQPVAATRTFAEASRHIQENLQKHLDRLPSTGHGSGSSSSSDDEGDTEVSNGLLDSVLAGYDVAVAPGVSRTSEAIAQAGNAHCLICISGLKKASAVWSCDKCYTTFHLNCIQQWANDCIFQQKNQYEDITQAPPDLKWACPKCRHERAQLPRKYLCYCGKVENPTFDPWILPHSCGEVCKRPLSPSCGHVCLILCHPGPCPPCPKMVKHDCHCGNSAPAIRRCFEKAWGCKRQCGKRLECGHHTCSQPCHQGACPPCSQTSVQLCRCQRHQRTVDCASRDWQCEEKCLRPLGCRHHVCEEVCHSGPCPPCPLSQLRTCPCGKTTHQLPCTEATPLCGNTCGKPLACGVHECSDRCHRGKCGSCLQMAKKSCRCGAKTREVACAKKDFTCEAKCKNMKQCGKHRCNKKCCEGSPPICPPLCDLPCNKTLSCRNHKCPSRCHGGPCLPCNQTKEVTCNCGRSRYLVPCGMEKSTKPPKCKVKCSIDPDCHHTARITHNCHFGDCPPCKQICRKDLPGCQHQCPSPCHDKVEVKVQLAQKAATPWEAAIEGTIGGVRREVKAVACPECQVPVSVTCLGGHETTDWPCHLAKPSSCGRPCGRRLPCGNHTCERSCHKVKSAASEVDAGSNCRRCEAGCDKPRACAHACPRACHPGECEPCALIIRVRCHCGLSQLYVKCGEWTLAGEERKAELGCCKDQCPKLLECGHRCFLTCHQGPCGDRKLCKKKVKVYCSCKRIKQDVQCNKAADFVVECNHNCQEAKKAVEKDSKKSKEVVEEVLTETTEEVKRGGKRQRNRRRYDSSNQVDQDDTFFAKNKTAILIVVVVLLPIMTAYYLCT